MAWSESSTTLRKALGVAEDTRLLVYLNSSDLRLEGLFHMGRGVGETLLKLGIALVGAPSFSVFVERPRLDQVFNLRRMFTVMGELEEHGLHVFPNVFAGNEYDIEAWTAWLEERPKVWIVGTVLQSQVPAFFDDQILKLIRLQKATEGRTPPLHVVLYGVGSPGRAIRARTLGLSRFSCVSSKAAMLAGHGRRMVWDGSRMSVTRDTADTRDHLLADNVRAEMAAFGSLGST
jgi:hypothetical protein